MIFSQHRYIIVVWEFFRVSLLSRIVLIAALGAEIFAESARKFDNKSEFIYLNLLGNWEMLLLRMCIEYGQNKCSRLRENI